MWKTVKEHFKIVHIVHVRDGKIFIGSPYVSEIISITLEGIVKWVSRSADNADLMRNYTEMSADPAKLRSLIEAPDTFEKSLPVYTYKGGEILEKQCEEYGWPNVTHDGCLMHENSFSESKREIIAYAKRNEQASKELAQRLMEKLWKDMSKAKVWKAESEVNLEKLNTLSE